MNINFELYKVFYEVTNENSISKGANKLMISQPAVTQSIKTLEDELGGKLFIRTPKGVILTNEGQELYNYIKEYTNYNFTKYSFGNIIFFLPIKIKAKSYFEDGLPYLLFYITALGKIYSNLNSLVKFIDTYVRFKGSKEQLDEYFKDCKETKLIKSFNKLKLSEVVFSYTKDSTKIVIPEFTLEKGDKISIMGQSGQGKTTAMNILAGLYPLENGKLTVNGKDKKDSRK